MRLFGIIRVQFRSHTRMSTFSQMKDMYKIQREAKRIKKELKNVHV